MRYPRWRSVSSASILLIGIPPLNDAEFFTLPQCESVCDVGVQIRHSEHFFFGEPHISSSFKILNKRSLRVFASESEEMFIFQKFAGRGVIYLVFYADG